MAAETNRKVFLKSDHQLSCDCSICGIERRTMYTRQESNSSFAWAEPYKELCPNCYLQEEEEKEEKADK